MSRITSQFSWSIPDRGISSWYEPFVSLIQEIDLSVSSVQRANAVPFMTLVLSAYPTDVLIHSGAEPSSFSVISCAPVGAFVGSFTMRNTPRWAWFDVRGVLGNSVSQVLPPQSPVRAALQMRVVVNPGSVDLGGADSSWILQQMGEAEPVHFVGATSLAAGPHSAELQWRLNDSVSASSQNISIGTLGDATGGAQNWAVMVVQEIDPPG
jgi:hypothetical protein